jgi:hypothetical protein
MVIVWFMRIAFLLRSNNAGDDRKGSMSKENFYKDLQLTHHLTKL